MRTKPLFCMLAPLLALALLAAAILPASAAPGSTTRVSVDSNGAEGNENSYYPAISADGRFVAFTSDADNLVKGDNNYKADVFVHDCQTGETTRVSVSSSGGEGNGDSYDPAVSADVRFVTFISYADNLVKGDNNEMGDIFVHDRQTGQTTRVSVSSSGVEGNEYSDGPAISADGCFVAFTSYADNLVAGDTNQYGDIFVHDRQTGKTTRVSVGPSGVEGNRDSVEPSISAEGRFVAFHSDATNLVTEDTNDKTDIFVHNRKTGETIRVSVHSNGAEGDGWSYEPTISADGCLVAFYSYATNLVSGDTNNKADVFVHDRQTGETTRVSVDSSGAEGNLWSFDPAISSDGHFVAFRSYATNLVVGDTNGKTDVFIHDRQSGKTTRVSVDSSGTEGNGDSYEPAISADGRFVAFSSYADNLVEDDVNKVFDIFVHDLAAFDYYLPLLIR